VFDTRVQHFAEVGSTNDVALDLASRGAEEGTVVCAGCQTAGRGRRGHSWYSPQGSGLYASLILRPPRWRLEEAARGQAVGLVTLAAGVGIAEALRLVTSLPVELKWPNDLIVPAPTAAGDEAKPRFRKLGGILAEAATDPSPGGGTQYIVLGFGINVLRTSFPPDIADRAVALDQLTSVPPDPQELLAIVLPVLARRVDDLSCGQFGGILSAWRRLAPSLVGARVTIAGAGGRRTGVARGIDDAGALMVETPAGVERVVSGEVEWDGFI
jgi:BirA family biotin operon repressor/biotin-[acetyl-CoA-carboxylase] ligase